MSDVTSFSIQLLVLQSTEVMFEVDLKDEVVKMLRVFLALAHVVVFIFAFPITILGVFEVHLFLWFQIAAWLQLTNCLVQLLPLQTGDFTTPLHIKLAKGVDVLLLVWVLLLAPGKDEGLDNVTEEAVVQLQLGAAVLAVFQKQRVLVVYEEELLNGVVVMIVFNQIDEVAEEEKLLGVVRIRSYFLLDIVVDTS